MIGATDSANARHASSTNVSGAQVGECAAILDNEHIAAAVSPTSSPPERPAARAHRRHLAALRRRVPELQATPEGRSSPSEMRASSVRPTQQRAGAPSGAPPRGEDYAHQQPSLTAKKLRLAEITAGAPILRGKRTGVWATREQMRRAERQLAHQAEASYTRMVRDLQAARPATGTADEPAEVGRA